MTVLRITVFFAFTPTAYILDATVLSFSGGTGKVLRCTAAGGKGGAGIKFIGGRSRNHPGDAFPAGGGGDGAGGNEHGAAGAPFLGRGAGSEPLQSAGEV